jgi:hypothetical protein
MDKPGRSHRENFKLGKTKIVPAFNVTNKYGVKNCIRRKMDHFGTCLMKKNKMEDQDGLDRIAKSGTENRKSRGTRVEKSRE